MRLTPINLVMERKMLQVSKSRAEQANTNFSVDGGKL